jgi:hypothetical protein
VERIKPGQGRRNFGKVTAKTWPFAVPLLIRNQGIGFGPYIGPGLAPEGRCYVRNAEMYQKKT